MSRYGFSDIFPITVTDRSKHLKAETDGTLQADHHKIYDSLAAKSWAIRLATEAANSILSVDSIIMSKPAGGPKVPQQAGNWDDDD